MRSIVKLAIVLTLTAALASVTTVASAQDSGHRIAVVDVAKIFKEHEAIKAQVAAVESKLKSYDEQFKAKREELQKEVEKLKTFSPGTPAYTQQEEKVASMESKLRLEMARTRKELADAEAKIYFDNYQQIAAAVADVAKYNKINLVLRYNSEDMDKAKGDSVVRGVMKNIVYHDSSMDMTAAIMKILSQRIAQGNAGTSAR
ncbi:MULTISPECIES: OmpH family outer membrane protein [Crateriforma]|uniref:Outer membrane protein (OmpH-like) n=1 Tax=Crateriforma conspicua TaxID=2527996 RepID=A0A5C5XZW4_9PLAN|nr:MULTISPECIES: OmpH family outer membrane protein [Crateriforma]QDV63143.1 Outer membrane protein (OmpH-like) [Crateriforma conspicua]TWT68089.1 Outer membrane protein (OmpH-like) [Crateriforma conspicua]TWU67557.1 Outer membrane protein (OmpH-like) [Crateriforma conspicua]